MFKKIFKITLVVLVLSAVTFLYFNQTSFNSILNTVSDYSKSESISAIKKEFIKSGRLVLEKVSSNSFLTKEGIFNGTNKQRLLYNLPTFKQNGQLDAVATLRMNDMFKNQYFEHVSPAGRSASMEADLVHYEYISIGENIALGDFLNDEDLVQAWMDSPGHRANILNSKFTELGVAVGKGEYDGRQTWIAVQVFAKPLSFCPTIDDSLKTRINIEIADLEQIQADLEERVRIIKNMERDKNIERVEYEQAVDEYNSMVRDLNRRSDILETWIKEYNRSVRDFNTCIQS